MARRAKDARAAKEARQKKIAIAGAILLLAVLAFQVPRTMKLLKGSESSAAAPAAPAPVAPAPGTGAAPAALGGGAAEAEQAGGRLVSFGRFESKDPFKPQVDPSQLGGGGENPAEAGGATETPAAEGVVQAPAATPPSMAPPSPTPPGVTPTAAVLSVNGVPERVTVGADFPLAEPTFRLVSLTAKAAKIAVAGGSYASGAATVTLRRGRTLTLMNTSDGRRYELRWLPDSAAPATAPPATASPPATAAPAPSGS